MSEDLLDFSVTANNWNYKSSCDWNSGTMGGGTAVGQCSDNDIKYIYAGNFNVRTYYSVLNLPPHYEIKVIVDAYFLDS